MNFEEQTKGMQVPGSAYYNILHIPENSRHNFLISVKEMMEDYNDQFDFWKNAWKIRDKNAEKLVNAGERFIFMKENCTGDVDHHLWAERWQRIDAKDPNYLTYKDRAEYLDYLSKCIPDKKSVSIKYLMKKLGLLKGEPNFDEKARTEFDRRVELSKS